MIEQREITLKLPPLYKEQSRLVDAFDNDPKIRYVIGACASKVGKAIPISEKIPTPNGWKTMGDLKENDFVFDDNGCPTKITYITDLMYDRPCYEVIFSDSSTVKCDADHLWKTTTKIDRASLDRGRKTKYPTICTTEEIRASLWYYSSNKEDKWPNHCVETCKPLQYSEKKLLVPPYLLGLWLGDGLHCSGSITINNEEIVEQIKKLGFECNKIVSSKYEWRVVGLTSILNKLGVLNYNKHIPDIYLRGSEIQRLELLCGLMDSDGYIDKRGRSFFYNTNKNLADSVEELCISLGMKVKRTTKIGKLNGVEKKLCYIVSFTTDLPIFKLQYKVARLRKIAKKATRRYIIGINAIPSEPVRCIRVENPNHLFLVGKACVPTHNTWGAAHRMVRQAFNNKGSLNWWIAPTYAQSIMACDLIKTFIPKKLYNWGGKSDFTLTIKDPAGGTHSKIQFKSAEREDSLRGFAVDFIVADEMARISEEAYTAFNTTTTQRAGKILYLSTPKGHNIFYDLFQKGNKSRLAKDEEDPFPQYFSMNLPLFVNPYLPQDAWKGLKASLPENMYRQEVLAEFLTDASSVFGKYKECIGGKLADPKPGHYYVAGVDLAKVHDYTVILITDYADKQVVYLERFNNIDWTLQKEKIKAACRRYNQAVCVLDASSQGDPIAEDLIRDGVRLYPYAINSNKAKRELIEKLVLSIEHKQIKYPVIPQLLRELEDYEINISLTGVITYSAPKGRNKFDDCVIALALSNYLLSENLQGYRYYSARGV